MLDLGAEGARLPGTDDLQAGIMIEVPRLCILVWWWCADAAGGRQGWFLRDVQHIRRLSSDPPRGGPGPYGPDW
jgi:hypothetical protein